MKLVVATTLASLCGCAGTDAGHSGGRGEVGGKVAVAQFGAMRPVMREGQSQPRVGLDEATRQPHAFAVGAMAGLEGEVTILDGAVWITRVVSGQPSASGPNPVPGDRATLLTLAHVPEWRSITLPEGAGGEELEAMIARYSREGGLDTTKPFPFRIEGELSTLDMHVINGFCPHSEGEATTANQPWTFTGAPPARVSIVGFYATGSEGEMTHHGTAIHAHAVVPTDAGRITGHVDALAVSAGATLMLPAAPR
jgi:acetolactate decarboxylase